MAKQVQVSPLRDKAAYQNYVEARRHERYSYVMRVSLNLSCVKINFKGFSMAKQIDCVVEAVRYKNGQIVVVRAYERRGFTFSDRLVLDRKTLLERLQKGQQFVSGTRQELKASTFTLAKSIMLVKTDDREYIATHENAAKDELENVPLF
jgi:hypothetical protein